MDSKGDVRHLFSVRILLLFGRFAGAPPPILGFPVTAMGVSISKANIGEHRANKGAR